MIVIRCDATAAIGGGHVARMVALAEALSDARLPVTFVANVDVPWLHRVVESSWQLLPPPPGTAEQVELFQQLDAKVLVIDSYVVDVDLAIAARKAGIKVVAIADHSSPRYQSDLVVVPALDRLDAAEFGVEAELVGGIQYALIRQELRVLRREMTPVDNEPLRVWVLMGGTDVAGVIGQVSSQVRLPTPCEVNFAPVQPGSELSTVGSVNGIAVRTHVPSPQLLAQVVGANLVVSAAGVSSFELLYLGLPTALVQVADNQAINFELLVARDLALPIHSPLPIAAHQFWEEVGNLLARSDLCDYGKRAATAVDGLGARRTAEAIQRLVD